jgi:hypothetical protein
MSDRSRREVIHGDPGCDWAGRICRMILGADVYCHAVATRFARVREVPADCVRGSITNDPKPAAYDLKKLQGKAMVRRIGLTPVRASTRRPLAESAHPSLSHRTRAKISN